MKKLSPTMSRLLEDAPDEWEQLPYSMGCTNATLNALESRGLVKTRVELGPRMPFGLSIWQWRRMAR